MNIIKQINLLFLIMKMVLDASNTIRDASNTI